MKRKIIYYLIGKPTEVTLEFEADKERAGGYKTIAVRWKSPKDFFDSKYMHEILGQALSIAMRSQYDYGNQNVTFIIDCDILGAPNLTGCSLSFLKIKL